MLKYTLFFLLTSILGLFSVILPAVIFSLSTCNQGLLFPPFYIGIEGISILSIIFMIFTGFVPGFVFGKKHFIWGLASVAFFPIILIVELFHELSSHSAWQLEIFVYVFLAAVATSGSIIGSIAKDMKRFRKEYVKNS